MMTPKPSLPRILCRATLALICFVAAPALAQPRAPAATAPAPQSRQAGPSQNATAAPAKATAGRMSKFEARRIRHACREHANERALRGAERDAFMLRCYFGRVSHRGLRKDCAQQGEAKGLDKNALRDFVRDCVKDRARQN